MDRFALYLRSTVFGITDSLVSTVGLLAGLAVAHTPQATIVLTGAVYAVVEAFSMAIGDFLSEESAEEYATRSAVSNRMPLFAGIVMFLAFVIAATIPLVPYVFTGEPLSLLLSIAGSILALFVTGAAGARFSRVGVMKRAFRMALLGGAAIAIGIAVAIVLPTG